VKYNATTGEETLYFNRMWQIRNGEAEWVQSKHIYVGETRVGTKYNSEGNENTGAERERIYYYHGDHLGSAQVVTNHEGQLYERLEYTPYGETWIEWKNPGLRLEEAAMPYRFTGKELDTETGLYYYGARYLDPKTSRWLSADPAVGDYLPGAPVDDAARRRNGSLPGQGGVFNLVNLHVYHYAGNNPIKYIDPDGNTTEVDEANGIVKNVIDDGNTAVMAYPYSSNGERLQGPGNYIGDTMFWDSFISPDTGKPVGIIYQNQSIDLKMAELFVRASRIGETATWLVG
jgi:RHS repeat-associated protein